MKVIRGPDWQPTARTSSAAEIPFLGINGDSRDPEPFEAYARLLRSLGGDARSVHLPDLGILGNGQTMPVERNNEQIADLIEGWVRDHLVPPMTTH